MALRYFVKDYLFDGSDSSFDFDTFIVTPASWGVGDSFKLAYNGAQTVAFVQGTNDTAANIQTALRTLFGDTGLTVTGVDGSGPFTVTPTAGFTVVDFLAPAAETNCTAPVTATFKDNLLILGGGTDFLSVAEHDQGADNSVYVHGLNRNFTNHSPVLVRRASSFITAGAGFTYELKDSEWGTELMDENPVDVVLTVPYPCNGLVFSGAALQDGDAVTLYIWYETPGDRRF